MSKYLKFFLCRLDISNLIDSEIMRIITRMLGEEPSEEIDGRFGILGALDNSNTVVYRIELTDEDILMLYNQIDEIGVDFDEKFERDYRHFHITLYKEINKNNDVSLEDEDEGTAREKEDDSWDVYYDEGSLQKYLKTNQEYLIFNVPNNEIGSLEDIEKRFKKWVDEQKEMITKKYLINFPGTILLN